MDAEVKPLTRCPACSSRLLAPTHWSTTGDDRVIERRCPECDHRDRVVVAARVARAWRRREQRIQLGLMGELLVLELERMLAAHPAPDEGAPRRADAG